MTTPDPFLRAEHADPGQAPGERLRRPEPSRTAPHRQSAGMLLPSGGETIDAGVNTAYRVLGDYLRRGQEAAHQQHAQTQTNPHNPWAAPRVPGIGGMGVGGMAAIPLQMFRAWAQLVASWADMSMSPAAGDGVRQMLRFTDELWAMTGGRQPTPEPPRNPSEPATTVVRPPIRFTVETSSAQPVEVDVEFDPPTGVRPMIQRLHPLRGDADPLTGLEFIYDASTGTAKLSLAVPAVQEPGRYVGTIFDDRDDRACGSVRVRIGD